MAKRRWRDEFERDVRHAWYVAMLERQKKIPSLETFLRRPGEKQTPAQQRAIIEMMAAKTGKTLRRTRLIRKDAPSDG